MKLLTMSITSSVYLSESVLHDGGELLSAVGREVQQLGATVRPPLQSDSLDSQFKFS